jgi:RNA polymerase sigma-70 factor (ECF subfamily)
MNSPSSKSAAGHDGTENGIAIADGVLMERICGRDKAAFEILVRSHQAAVHGFLRARTLQKADVDDLAQEVFLRTYLTCRRFQADARLRPWILGIARNVLREYVRSARRRREVAWTELCLELDELVGSSEEPENGALDHLPTCLDALGPNARQALDLHYGVRMDLVAIGQRLHRSEGAVKLLLFRARQALRQCIAEKLSRDAHDR